MRSDESDESVQRIEYKMLMSKLDNALLFFSSSLSLAYTVGNALVGLDWVRYFIPVIFLCWVLPVYVGYIRGSLCKDSILERFRGWIYLFMGGSTYAVYISAWKFASILGFDLESSIALSFPAIIVIVAFVIVLSVAVFIVFVPNLSVLWLLATEGKGRRISWKMAVPFLIRSSSIDYTAFAAILFAVSFWYAMLGLYAQQWLMSAMPGGLQISTVFIPGWIAGIASFCFLFFLLAVATERTARMQSQIWRLKGGRYSVDELGYVNLNGQWVVAEEISAKLQDVRLLFPVRLIGVDLLVSSTRTRKRIGIQVNASEYIDRMDRRRKHVGSSNHQIKTEWLDKGGDKVDFCVFLTRWPVHGIHEKHPFKYRFLILPSSELEKRLTIKDAVEGSYTFCFHFDKNGKKVWDKGVEAPPDNPLADYSQFLDAWELLNKALQ